MDVVAAEMVTMTTSTTTVKPVSVRVVRNKWYVRQHDRMNHSEI